MARPPATAPVKKRKPFIPDWYKHQKKIEQHGLFDVGGALKSFWINTIANPVAGDFKKNRGKVVIGIVAGVVLLGGGFKLINGATGGGITKGALTIAAPEIEAASVAKQGLKQRATRRLHAREPVAPMRYAMRKANP